MARLGRPGLGKRRAAHTGNYPTATSSLCLYISEYDLRDERVPFPILLQGVVGAWQEAITRLIERGVTGKIVLSNLVSLKGFPVSVICVCNAHVTTADLAM